MFFRCVFSCYAQVEVETSWLVQLNWFEIPFSFANWNIFHQIGYQRMITLPETNSSPVENG